MTETSEESYLWVGSMSIVRNDLITEELAELEEVEFKAHRLCEEAWGEDPMWYQEETRFECKYSVCASDKEVNICNRVTGKIRTIAIDKIGNPAIDITNAFRTPETSRTPGSVREGGFPVIDEYNKWEWPAINWMMARLRGQLLSVDKHNAPEGVKDKDRIDVQPTMFGYSIQLDESDIIYNISHEEVLDKFFGPGWIIDQMITAWKVPADNRGDRFTDKRMSKYITIMLGMTTIPRQKETIKKRGNKKRTIDPEGVPAVERTTMRLKDKSRRLPEPITVAVKVNGQMIRALLDTGSMADFISTTVVEQLKLPKEIYEKLLAVQLMVHGSRSKINCGTTVRFQYQMIDCDRRFNVANLDNYDAILGTPFLYQHQVAIAFNSSRVVVGSSEPMEMEGPEITTIPSAAAEVLNEGLDKIRRELRKEAEDLCPDTSKMDLPPMRAINHLIPLIDENKKYHYRPLKCPEAFRKQWLEKRSAYLKTGRWRTVMGHNLIPMLMIPKMSSSKGLPTLRTVFDKQEQNMNTQKLASPLPDMDEIL